MSSEKRPSNGPSMGVGIGLGMAVGVAIGVAMGKIAVGIAIGVSIGVAIGSGLERRRLQAGEGETAPASLMPWLIGAVVVFVGLALLYTLLLRN